MPNTSCSIICESGWNKVNQDRKTYRRYNPREKCCNWSHQGSKCQSYVFVSDTNRWLGETMMAVLHDNPHTLQKHTPNIFIIKHNCDILKN